MDETALKRSAEEGKLGLVRDTLLSRLKECDLCPRKCHVDRLSGEKGFCRTGRFALVSSYGPHYGEEFPLVGRHGSGTVFFTHCNLGCIFCQNYDISHLGEGREVTPEQLAEIFLSIQRMGCHNLNLVTPTHVVAQVVESLALAVEEGFSLPVVYNCGGYEDPDVIRLLDGVVDIYMPDVKFFDPAVAEELARAPDYPRWVKESVVEMHRQVGDLVIDSSGVARKGLLVRHLVLPGGLAGTEEVLAFLRENTGPETYLNIMDQYYPCYMARSHPLLSRRIYREEWEEALSLARRLGFRRIDSDL
ncbi:MAG: radical SAM protein [Deltaproteobacteria bacterium]|nr:MAG: radical SAM protein [Deltaproteobacteria bacterium]